MAFSSGTFSLVAGNPLVTGTTISSTWANNTLNDIATGLSTCILKDGTQTLTADIPMGTFKLTGLGAGAANGNSVRYEQISGWAVGSIPLPRGHIAGLALSNNGTATKLDVAAGMCADSTDAANIVLASAITAGLIQTSGSWSAGSTQNKLDTGARANTTWYHVFAIRKDSDGSGDWLFSLSATSPTMPAGYTYFRRIGSVLTDGSGNITAFSQNGNEFLWAATVADVTITNSATTTAVTAALTVPTGVKVNALISAEYTDSASAGFATRLSSLDQNDEAPALNFNNSSLICISAGNFSAAHFDIRTNTSAQIRYRNSGSNNYLHLGTFGWIDTRGRNA